VDPDDRDLHIPDQTAFQAKLNLVDEPIQCSELKNAYQTSHLQSTPVHENNLIPRTKFPSPRQLAPVTADHENVRTGFGPEVLAASN
jgi:hypothetical protein